MTIKYTGLREEWKLLVAAFLCSAVHQYLFFAKTWGLSYPLFVMLFYGYFYWAVKEKQQLRWDIPAFLLIPVMLLSLTYAVFTNMLFYVLNALVVPLLIVIHTTWTMRPAAGEGKKGNFVIMIGEQIFVHTVKYLPKPVVLVWRSITAKIKANESKVLLKVLIGMLISIPLLFVVVALLASADFMFDQLLFRLPEWFGDLELGRTLLRIIWIVVVGSGLFAYVSALLHRHQRQSDFREQTASVHSDSQHILPSRWLDPTIAATILVSLNAVYLIFTIVQFSYFFGGGAAELPVGMTYAAYARRGFAELVFVTLINFGVLMSVMYGAKRSESSISSLILRGLLAVLVVCSGIMLSSAYLRLSMYEEAYGYTVTRLLVHAFMIFLAVQFLLALAKIAKERMPLMKYCVIAGLSAYIMINYMNIDAVIAKNNILRYESTGKLDADYLSGLSFEAAPYLLELKKKHPEAPGVDTALEAVRSRLPFTEEKTWVEFNWSEWKAAKSLGMKSGD